MKKAVDSHQATPLIEHAWPPLMLTTPYSMAPSKKVPTPSRNLATGDGESRISDPRSEARNSLTNMHLPPEYAITDDVATVHAAVQPHLEPTKAEWDAETLLRTAEGAIHYFHHQLQLIRGQPSPHWATLPWKLIRALLDGSGPKDTQSLRHTMASLGNSGINGIRIGCATPSALPPTFCRVGEAIGQLNGVDQYLFVRYGPGGGNMNFKLRSATASNPNQLPKPLSGKDLPPSYSAVKSVDGSGPTGPHWVENGKAYWLLISTAAGNPPGAETKEEEKGASPKKGGKKGKKGAKKQQTLYRTAAVEVIRLSTVWESSTPSSLVQSKYSSLLQCLRPGWTVDVNGDYAVCYCSVTGDAPGVTAELLAQEDSPSAMLRGLFQSLETKDTITAAYGATKHGDAWLRTRFGLSEWRALHPRRLVPHSIGLQTDGETLDWVEIFPSWKSNHTSATADPEAIEVAKLLGPALASRDTFSPFHRWLLLSLVWQFPDVFGLLLHDSLPTDELKSLPLSELPSKLFYRCAAAVLEGSASSSLASQDWMTLARGFATRGLDISISGQVDTLQRLWHSLQPLLITATSELQAVETPGSREWMLMHLHLPLLFRCFAALQFTEAEPPTGFVDLVKSMVSVAWDALQGLLPKALATAEGLTHDGTVFLGLLLSVLLLSSTAPLSAFSLLGSNIAVKVLEMLQSLPLKTEKVVTQGLWAGKHHKLVVPVYFGYTSQVEKSPDGATDSQAQVSHSPPAPEPLPETALESESEFKDESQLQESKTSSEIEVAQPAPAEEVSSSKEESPPKPIESTALPPVYNCLRPWRRQAVIPIPPTHQTPLKISIDSPETLLPDDIIVVSIWRHGQWTDVKRIIGGSDGTSAKGNSIAIHQRISAVRMELQSARLACCTTIAAGLPPLVRLTVKAVVPAEDAALPTASVKKAALSDLLVRVLHRENGNILAQVGTAPSSPLVEAAGRAQSKVIASPLLKGGLLTSVWRSLLPKFSSLTLDSLNMSQYFEGLPFPELCAEEAAFLLELLQGQGEGNALHLQLSSACAANPLERKLLKGNFVKKRPLLEPALRVMAATAVYSLGLVSAAMAPSASTDERLLAIWRHLSRKRLELRGGEKQAIAHWALAAVQMCSLLLCCVPSLGAAILAHQGEEPIAAGALDAVVAEFIKVENVKDIIQNPSAHALVAQSGRQWLWHSWSSTLGTDVLTTAGPALSQALMSGLESLIGPVEQGDVKVPLVATAMEQRTAAAATRTVALARTSTTLTTLLGSNVHQVMLRHALRSLLRFRNTEDEKDTSPTYLLPTASANLDGGLCHILALLSHAFTQLVKQSIQEAANRAASSGLEMGGLDISLKLCYRLLCRSIESGEHAMLFNPSLKELITAGLRHRNCEIQAAAVATGCTILRATANSRTRITGQEELLVLLLNFGFCCLRSLRASSQLQLLHDEVGSYFAEACLEGKSIVIATKSAMSIVLRLIALVDNLLTHSITLKQMVLRFTAKPNSLDNASLAYVLCSKVLKFTLATAFAQFGPATAWPASLGLRLLRRCIHGSLKLHEPEEGQALDSSVPDSALLFPTPLVVRYVVTVGRGRRKLGIAL